MKVQIVTQLRKQTEAISLVPKVLSAIFIPNQCLPFLFRPPHHHTYVMPLSSCSSSLPTYVLRRIKWPGFYVVEARVREIEHFPKKPNLNQSTGTHSPLEAIKLCADYTRTSYGRRMVTFILWEPMHDFVLYQVKCLIY